MSTEIQNAINTMQAIIEKINGDETTSEIESYEYYLAGFFREFCYYFCGEHADTDSWPMNYDLFGIIVQAVNDCAP